MKNLLIGAISGNYSPQDLKNWVETSNWENCERVLLLYNPSNNGLEDYLKQYKRVLLSVGSIREQTLAGVAANCVNSLGGTYTNQFCDVIDEITYIDNEGKIKKIVRKSMP